MDSRSVMNLSSRRQHNSTRLHCPFLDRLVNGGEEVPMGGETEPIGLAEARSALGWWLEAGVDTAVQEQPRDWLKPAPRPSALAPVANVSEPSHDTLAELQTWLASSAELPLASATARRILPHGHAWQVASRMLAAIGMSADDAYSASLSCFHTPGARMSEADRKACAEVARRHVRLVEPKRLILFGDGPSLALLGKRLVEARGHVHKVEGVRTVATFHPRHLIKRPLDKSLAWRDLLLLMEDEA
jgi:uracil-DNA glycosylase